MSVVETTTSGAHEATSAWSRPQSSYETSPFAGAALSIGAAVAREVTAPPSTASIRTPFAEALASLDEADLELEAFDALRAEFEDEGFLEALEALADEAAARHLTAAGSWSQESEGMQLASSEAEQWMETVAAQADRLLAELESHFGERGVDTVGAGEIEAVAGWPQEFEHLASPVDAQEQFLKKLVDKVKKVAKGVGKVIGKGISAVAKLVPLGKLFGIFKKLVRPLLNRVLQRAIGKLPEQLRPAATTLATKLGLRKATGPGQPARASDGAAPGPAGAPAGAAAAGPADTGEPAAADAAAGESAWSTEALADEFDARLAEAVLAPHDEAANQMLAQYESEVGTPAEPGREGPYTMLDTGRQRLAQQLLAAEPGQPPVAELEEFIPVVMAAMKLVKLGVRVIGRKRVVEFLAKLLATLIQGMVGQEAARALSRHVADAGLRLLGLEAERVADGTLGAEALIATAEDTIREVLALPAESMDNELLLEAAVQEAFTAAAVRHFPAEVLRPDLAPQPEDGERGIWLMFPRAVRPHYRYKKYTVVQPVQLTRPLARAVVFTDGETLEDRMLDAGVRSWPVPAEAHFYELMPGAELGHLAAFEVEGATASYAEAAMEFDQLAPGRPQPIAHPRDRDHRAGGAHPGTAHPGAPGGAGGPRHRQPGGRVVRIVVRGLRLRHRPPFSLRLDVAGSKPQLRLHLHVSERVAHELVEHLAKQRMAQVVAVIRRLVGEPVRQALAGRVHRMLTRRGITPAEGASARLAAWLAEAASRAVAKQLPAAATALATAAKDQASGVTLTFTFTFNDRQAIAAAKGSEPELSIRSGVHRD